MLIEHHTPAVAPYAVIGKGLGAGEGGAVHDPKTAMQIGEAHPARARRILVVDDEVPIVRQLRRILIASGYDVLSASSGMQGLEMARQEQPDLILLDLSMPGMNGLAVCRELRQRTETPIIVVSARTEERYKVHALDLGADDYLTKPFGSEELLARVRVCLRRSVGRQGEGRLEGKQDTLQRLASEDGYLVMDLGSRQVWAGTRLVRLTPKEFELLHELMAAPDLVLTHGALLKTIWGPEYKEETEYLRVFIRQLRRKIEQDPSHPRYLLTEPGVGYVFRPRQGQHQAQH